MIALGERKKEKKVGKRPKGQTNGSDRDKKSSRKENRVNMFRANVQSVSFQKRHMLAVSLSAMVKF